MAFPTTAVLDNFNTGATQNLTARAGWGASPFLTTQSSFQTDAVPTKAGLTAIAGNNWGTLTWADMEAYLTLVAFVPSADIFHLCGRIQAFGASPTYYALRLAAVAATDFQLIKIVAGTTTALGTNTSTTITAGDSIGIDIIGTQIRSYYKSGAGSWTLKDTVTDSAITGTGAIGCRHLTGSAAATIDDFGGGLIAPAGRSRIAVARRVWAGR